jgi:hypothetical protein
MRSVSKAMAGGALLAALLLCLLAGPAARAQNAPDPQPSSVEVYWHSSRSVVVPGVASVVVLDENIARATAGADSILFEGLQRGDTVALAYVNGEPLSIIVHVVGRPLAPVTAGRRRPRMELGEGVFASTVQVARFNGQSTALFLNDFSWAQEFGKKRLDFRALLESSNQPAGHALNLPFGSISYLTPRARFEALDFSVSLTGDAGSEQSNPYAVADFVQLRGAAVTLHRGANRFAFFAGATVPYYFLSLRATRDVAGFTFSRPLTGKLDIFAGTVFANIPLASDPAVRRNYAMQTAGARFRPTKNWVLDGLAGGSNRGGMLRGDASYLGRRVTAFASAVRSSQFFPMNQLETLFSGTTSLRSGMSLTLTHRLTGSVAYQHVITSPGLLYIRRAVSDYLSQSLTYAVTPRQTVGFTYTYSRNSGGFGADTTTGHRYVIAVQSRFARSLTNAAQLDLGSVQDPLQLNSEDRFSFRDTFGFPIGGQNHLFVSFDHSRVNPSLVQKLNGELSLLSPQLQTLFQQDPVAFLQSGNLPPEIRALLAANQPISTSVAVTGSLHFGRRLSVDPSVSVARMATGASQEGWTHFLGYSAVYQVNPRLQVRSSLTTQWLWSGNSNVQRTTLLSFGVVKSFNGLPRFLNPVRRNRTIEGRVFRDNQLDGTFGKDDQGLPGIQVQLDGGETATTDAQGRYRFEEVPAGDHEVSLALAQFPGPVRMTTLGAQSVDLAAARHAAADFGIVDFARVMGSVFNDLRLDGERVPDTGGLQHVRLVLANASWSRTLVSDGAGAFEASNVPPGDYTLTVDRDTIPANYFVAAPTMAVHVTPVSTVVEDVPVRALRSISGRVLLQVAETPEAGPGSLSVTGVPGGAPESRSGRGFRQDGRKLGQAPGQVQGATPSAAKEGAFKLVPLAGVQLTADHTVVKTDENGNFLLRNLPAGDLTVTLVPYRPLPDGLHAPSGPIHMPDGPIAVQGATIVISNPALLPYLTESK